MIFYNAGRAKIQKKLRPSTIPREVISVSYNEGQEEDSLASGKRAEAEGHQVSGRKEPFGHAWPPHCVPGSGRYLPPPRRFPCPSSELHLKSRPSADSEAHPRSTLLLVRAGGGDDNLLIFCFQTLREHERRSDLKSKA